jgi:hypothetical protein
LIRAGVRDARGDFVNAKRLTVAGWDAAGNPVPSDGRSITRRNLPCATCLVPIRRPPTPVKARRTSKVITGFDRHFIRSATRKIAYVACSRRREGIEVFAKSIADLSQIQNRTGDRKAAVKMAFEDGLDDRAELKRLFRHLQRVRAARRAEAHERHMALRKRENASKGEV